MIYYDRDNRLIQDFFKLSELSSDSVREVIYQTRESVSLGYPNTEKRVENTTRSGVFLTKFEVFG